MASDRRFIVIYRQGSSDVVHFDKDLIERRLNPSEGGQFYENWRPAAIVSFEFNDAELRPADLFGSYLYFSPELDNLPRYDQLTADDCLSKTREYLDRYPMKIIRL